MKFELERGFHSSKITILGENDYVILIGGRNNTAENTEAAKYE
jgi:hypothetical protein